MADALDMTSDECLWTPTKPFAETNIGKFAKFVEEQYGKSFTNYWALHNWSVTKPTVFWAALARHCGLCFARGGPSDSGQPPVVDPDSRPADLPRWFPGAELNYADNLLADWPADKPALLTCREGDAAPTEVVTFGQLRQRTANLQAALLAAGVSRGDRVAGWLPNGAEAVVGLLACAGLGAIWTSASPDFGVQAVLDRFGQVEPAVLLAVDRVRYGGKVHDGLAKAAQAAVKLPSLRQVLVVRGLPGEPGSAGGLPDGDPRFVWYDDAVEAAASPSGQQQPPQLQLTPLPFEQPLYILYSSGTTGPPKCLVHGAGGSLLQHAKEHRLHADLGPADTLFYFTSTGWMMWNWAVSGLAAGAALVLYDGSPLLPSREAVWRLVEACGTTVLGASAKWLAVLEAADFQPPEPPRRLRCLLSTGSPLAASTFRYVYSRLGSDLLLGSITGGTDIVGCFAGSNPTLPVHAGEIQSPNLGMAVQCWDGSGRPVSGERGELVCVRPFPSQPVRFWADEPDGRKYRAAYFSGFGGGVWTHGDFCAVNPRTRGIRMLGRSDGTLNPNGVRFGSAEIYQVSWGIYQVVDAFPEVADSLCVAQTSRRSSDERVLLFLRLADGPSALTPELESRIKSAIRAQLSPRHVPAVVRAAELVPYTFSGKKVELAVRQLLQSEPVLNRNAVANPEALDHFAAMTDLQDY
ncbi:hypothetical protein BOX15_Mlig017081g1 [Macrostomum lignano]|uniref:Acetoacetyl-CoA synthetase n=1 Tax=Macrostomum lignano TaxID=282301 RepID=A0A267EAV1_9PLAT|nr:hypothetical protein BOX15_Mlig017081g1 [Macrostomum lignano]